MQLFLLLSSCAQLPEYARPYLMEIDNKQEGLKNGITYRQLTVDDFQASELPANIKPHAKSIGAHIRRSNYWPCLWADDWSAPVSDAGKLAQLPQTQGPAKPCDKLN